MKASCPNCYLTINDFGPEDKSGSTGYRANIAFKLNTNELIGDTIPSDEISNLKIEKVSLYDSLVSTTKTPETGKAYTQYTYSEKTTLTPTSVPNEIKYFWNSKNNSINPAITGVIGYIDLNGLTTRTRSGVTYFNGGTANKIKFEAQRIIWII
jgi:hypothetical protein